jgi:hypothetical protein
MTILFPFTASGTVKISTTVWHVYPHLASLSLGVNVSAAAL